MSMGPPVPRICERAASCPFADHERAKLSRATPPTTSEPVRPIEVGWGRLYFSNVDESTDGPATGAEFEPTLNDLLRVARLDYVEGGFGIDRRYPDEGILN